MMTLNDGNLTSFQFFDHRELLKVESKNKKIIGDLLYDAKKSKLIYESKSKARQTVELYTEKIFITKNKNWFKIAELGEIIPLTEKQVIEYLVENNAIDTINKYFPEYLKEA